MHHSITTRAPTIPSRLLLGKQLTLINGLSSRLLVQELQGDLGGVFFGIVDVLTIVPVAGRNILTLHGDGAGPGGSTTCISEAKAVSIRCQARK